MDLNLANQEVQKVETYMKCTLPPIIDITYDNSTYWGKVKDDEIKSTGWLLHLSNKIHNCPEQFQKSVIWHESIHAHDTLLLRNSKLPLYEGIMCTYSESHATSVQLRYLLGLNPTQIFSNNNATLINSTGKTNLGTMTSSFVNQSIHAFNKLQSTHSPKDFQSFIVNFCYLCGYLMLKPRKDANTLIKAVIPMYSKYNIELDKLYHSIMAKDFKMCAIIYDGLVYNIVSNALE